MWCVVGATHWNGNEKSFGMRVEGAVVTGEDLDFHVFTAVGKNVRYIYVGYKTKGVGDK